MGHRINHKNIGNIQKHAYLEGTILKVYGSSEEDPAYWDTADINIALDSGDISGVHIPLFYHCSHDAVLRDNGALAGASAAFSEDDKVIVQCEITSAGHYKPLRVMGFMDKPKACGWIEDWEGETITSNHFWYNLSAYGTGCPDIVPDAALFEFDDENILKVESIVSHTGTCRCRPTVDLTSLPEQPLNLKNLSGFECEAYLAEFEPQTFTEAFCLNNCIPTGIAHTIWHIQIGFGLSFTWRLVGSDSPSTTYYGYSSRTWCYETDYACHIGCCEGGPVHIGYGEEESFASFISKIGSWVSLPLQFGEPVPWLNSNYELIAIQPKTRLILYEGTAEIHGITNMKVYFSDITIK